MLTVHERLREKNQVLPSPIVQIPCSVPRALFLLGLSVKKSPSPVKSCGNEVNSRKVRYIRLRKTDRCFPFFNPQRVPNRVTTKRTKPKAPCVPRSRLSQRYAILALACKPVFLVRPRHDPRVPVANRTRRNHASSFTRGAVLGPRDEATLSSSRVSWCTTFWVF